MQMVNAIIPRPEVIGSGRGVFLKLNLGLAVDHYHMALVKTNGADYAAVLIDPEVAAVANWALIGSSGALGRVSGQGLDQAMGDGPSAGQLSLI